MQIRVRHGRVEYLRPWYDKEAKRSRQKVIRPEEFTPEEKAEADAYAAKQAEESSRAMAVWAVTKAHDRLDEIAAGLDAGGRPADESAFWAALARLRKAMRKAGLQQPRADRVPETLTGKLPLEDD